VVLKMLRVPCAGGQAASAAQRALREAEMMRALPASAHLLELLSVFCMPSADGSAHVLVLVLPYYPHGSLADELGLRMRRQPARPYSEDEVRTVLRDLAHALAVAHDARIVHRDVKPENVLRADDGHLVRTQACPLRDFSDSRL
jgi:serine/threonine protein kinase